MATPKQLAALKKARAARGKKKVVRKAPAKRATKTVRKSNPSFYAVVVKLKNTHGYLSAWTIKGPMIEQSASKALKLNRVGAEALKHAIYTCRPSGVISVDAVIIGDPGKK